MPGLAADDLPGRGYVGDWIGRWHQERRAEAPNAVEPPIGRADSGGRLARYLLAGEERDGRDSLSLVAAGVAFYGLLSLFPAITVLVSIYGLVVEPQAAQQQVAALGEVLPQDTRQILDEQLTRVTASANTALAFGVIVGIVLALWSAGAGTKALIEGLNIVYDEEEKRGFIKLNAVALGLTLGLILFMILALALVAILPALSAALACLRPSSTGRAGCAGRSSRSPSWSRSPLSTAMRRAARDLDGDGSPRGAVRATVALDHRLAPVLLVRLELRQLQRDLRLARRGRGAHAVVLGVGADRAARRRINAETEHQTERDTTRGANGRSAGAAPMSPTPSASSPSQPASSSAAPPA